MNSRCDQAVLLAGNDTWTVTATAGRHPQAGQEGTCCDPVFLEGQAGSTARRIERRNPAQPEFHQAVREVLETLAPVLAARPEYAQPGLVERLCEPERQIIFRVPWQDDRGAGPRQPRLPRRVQQRARPVQGRPALPPVGEPRHREVPRLRADLQERPDRARHRRRQGRQRLRPARPLGRRGHALLPVLHDRAAPAHRRAHRRARPATSASAAARSATCSASTGASPTAGRPASSPARAWAGAAPRSAPRPPATAACSSRRDAGRRGEELDGPDGRGLRLGQRRAVHDREAAAQLGANPLTCSDSGGYVVDDKGIDLALLKQIKEVERGARQRVRGAARRLGAASSPGGRVWDVPATSPSLPPRRTNWTPQDARTLVEQRRQGGRRGRQHADHPRGRRILQEAGVAFGPGKAANAGGVAVSALEMSQNAARDSWPRGRVEDELAAIMRDIHAVAYETAERYGAPGRLRRRREHRRLRAGRGRDARAGGHLTGTAEGQQSTVVAVRRRVRAGRPAGDGVPDAGKLSACQRSPGCGAGHENTEKCARRSAPSLSLARLTPA